MSALFGSPRRISLVAPNHVNPSQGGLLLHYSWERERLCALQSASAKPLPKKKKDTRNTANGAMARVGITVRVALPPNGSVLGVAWRWQHEMQEQRRLEEHQDTSHPHDAPERQRRTSGCVHHAQLVWASCLPRSDRQGVRAQLLAQKEPVSSSSVCMAEFDIERFYTSCKCDVECMLVISWSREVSLHGIVTTGQLDGIAMQRRDHVIEKEAHDVQNAHTHQQHAHQKLNKFGQPDLKLGRRMAKRELWEDGRYNATLHRFSTGR